MISFNEIADMQPPLETLQTIPEIGALGILVYLIPAISTLFTIIFYVYRSLAFYRISQKARITLPGLSWIPFIGPHIQTYRISKKSVIYLVILISALVAIVGITSYLYFTTINLVQDNFAHPLEFIEELLPLLLIWALLSLICLIAICTIAYIFLKETFKNLGRPGWWALPEFRILVIGLPFIGPFLYLIFTAAHYIFIGIAAWGK